MTVMDAIKMSKSFTFTFKGSIKAAEKMLSPSEEVLWAITGSIASQPISGELSTDPSFSSNLDLPGVTVVTNQRILFVCSVLGQINSREMQISSVRSIDLRTSIQLNVIRVIGITDMLVTMGSKKQLNGLRDAINEALSRINTTTVSAPSQESADNDLDTSDIEQLQALKQLYDSGVITAEEFAAKKAQILNL